MEGAKQPLGAGVWEQSNIAGDNGGEKFNGECADFNYKLILIGNSQAGKTSITNKFVDDSFNDKEERSRNVQIQRKIIKIENSDNKWA
jgi:GTPase SAR1 family protein